MAAKKWIVHVRKSFVDKIIHCLEKIMASQLDRILAVVTDLQIQVGNLKTQNSNLQTQLGEVKTELDLVKDAIFGDQTPDDAKLAQLNQDVQTQTQKLQAAVDTAKPLT